jgi:hypothetical protein
MAALISCEEALEKMLEALEGSQTPELLDHLAGCESCLAQWRRLEAVHALLGSAPALNPSPEFKAKVMAAVRREVALKRAIKALVASPLVFFAAAALAIGLVALALRLWDLLPAFRILLEMALSWLWRLKWLVKLALEVLLVSSRLTFYFALVWLMLLAIFAKFVKREVQNEVA